MPEEKAWRSLVPTGDGECHSPESQDPAERVGGEQVRWLTVGTARVFGHFTGDLLSYQKRNPAAVDQNLNMYFHGLNHCDGRGTGRRYRCRGNFVSAAFVPRL